MRFSGRLIFLVACIVLIVNVSTCIAADSAQQDTGDSQYGLTITPGIAAAGFDAVKHETMQKLTKRIQKLQRILSCVDAVQPGHIKDCFGQGISRDGR